MFWWFIAGLICAVLLIPFLMAIAWKVSSIIVAVLVILLIVWLIRMRF